MRRLAATLALLWLSGCNNAETPVEPPPHEDSEPAATLEAPAPELGFLATRSPIADGLGEVVLDPRATAALTLEQDGTVRLHDSLATGAAAPWLLPVRDPLWMTLARRGDGFVIALLDTGNAAQVLELVPHGDTAAVERRFALEPEQPQLEIHVLDGGERILALGVDHRLRLFDLDGRELSVLDERGFAPWQLRLTGGDGSEPLHLAVTLAGPLRIQKLSLDGDQLRRVGEAHEVSLDRGPNRNDLILTRDGRHAAALRRHKAAKPEWSVELIELDSGARSLIAGRLDTPVRARMHALAGALLLESGSGRAYVIDLARATPLRRRDDADPDSRFALELARSTEHPTLELGLAVEALGLLPEGDTGLRMHASVVGRMRAGIGAQAELELGPLPE